MRKNSESVEMRLKNFQPHFSRFNRISTEPGNFCMVVKNVFLYLQVEGRKK